MSVPIDMAPAMGQLRDARAWYSLGYMGHGVAPAHDPLAARAAALGRQPGDSGLPARDRSSPVDPHTMAASSTITSDGFTSNGEGAQDQDLPQWTQAVPKRNTRSKSWLGLKPRQLRVLIGLFVLDMMILLIAAAVLFQ